MIFYAEVFFTPHSVKTYYHTVNQFSLFLCSEEIAFYQGNRREQTIILATFDKLVSFVEIYETVQPND